MLASRTRRWFASFVAMAAVGVAVPNVATAAWSGPLTISAVGGSLSQVAVGPDGDTAFTWEIWDGADYRIQTRRRTAAGALRSIRTISAAGRDAHDPQVAVDGAGNAIFTWARSDGTDPGACCTRIQARRRAAGGALGTVQTLSAPGQSASTPEVAVNDAGNAVFTWRRFDGTAQRVQARARTAAGALGSIQTLSPAGGDARANPQVGVDDAGNALFTWTLNYELSEDPAVHARRRSAAGALSSIQPLSAGRGSQVAVEGDGDAVFTWARDDHTDPGFCCWRVQARTRAASGALGLAQTLSTPRRNGSSAPVAVDDAGHAVATWLSYWPPPTPDFYIQAAVGP